MAMVRIYLFAGHFIAYAFDATEDGIVVLEGPGNGARQNPSRPLASPIGLAQPDDVLEAFFQRLHLRPNIMVAEVVRCSWCAARMTSSHSRRSISFADQPANTIAEDLGAGAGSESSPAFHRGTKHLGMRCPFELGDMRDLRRRGMLTSDSDKVV